MTISVKVSSLRRIKPLIIQTVAAYAMGVSLFSQPFSNLDFQDANTNGLTMIPYRDPNSGKQRVEVDGPTTALIPSWQITFQGKQVTQTFIDPNPSMHPEINPPFLFTGSPIGGHFALNFTSEPGDVPTTLSQSGAVPGNAQFLAIAGRAHLDVNLNGQTLKRQPFFPGDINSTRWDISPFAGQVGNLTIATSTIFPGGGELDRVSFLSVPEPEVCTLAAIGCIVFFARFTVKIGKERTSFRMD